MATQTNPQNVSEHRPAAARGTTHIGWLDSRHSFSFGGYHDPARMGYHGLRVLNDDRVAPGQGFDTHPHRDMEILTWVLDGELAHRDSMGHASTLGAGTAQLMSAGTGVLHSEHNASTAAPVHFLQVWIEPRERGAEPRYQEQVFDADVRANALIPIATPDGRDGSLTIGADAEVYVVDLQNGQAVTHELTSGRVAYAHLATGSATVNGQALEAGDAVTIEQPASVTLSSDSAGQVMLFVLPA